MTSKSPPSSAKGKLSSLQALGPPAMRVVEIKKQNRKPFCNYRKYMNMERRELERDPFITYADVEKEYELTGRQSFKFGQFVVTDHRAAVQKRESHMMSANCGVLGGKYTKNDKAGQSSHWSPHRDVSKEKWLDKAWKGSSPPKNKHFNMSQYRFGKSQDEKLATTGSTKN